MIDHVDIRVRAGRGGNGAISFRREKFVPYGGPDGGDGGNGGNIVFRADSSTTNLRRFKQKGFFRAEGGLDGGGNRKHGREGKDTILNVPQGTVISQVADGSLRVIADLEQIGDKAVVARGGKGGWGNTRFASATNQTPRFARKGDEGEELILKLEMRIIADVGIIGYPNAGKSTLLAKSTAAHPKIANYPFTTLEPALGMVESGQEVFVMAEIPGLIMGAHQGKGLGYEFLQHIMRTRVLLHLIDGSSETPIEDMVNVNGELAAYDAQLVQKPQIVVVNKIDLPEVEQRLEELKEVFRSAGISAHYISAETGQAVPELMAAVLELLNSVKSEEPVEKLPEKIFRPEPKTPALAVSKADNEFVISAPEMEKLVAGQGMTQEELRWHVYHYLMQMGLHRVLVRAGAQPGDRIRLGEYIWDWSGK
jgi:GTP-binding protein